MYKELYWNQPAAQMSIAPGLPKVAREALTGRCSTA